MLGSELNPHLTYELWLERFAVTHSHSHSHSRDRRLTRASHPGLPSRWSQRHSAVLFQLPVGILPAVAGIQSDSDIGHSALQIHHPDVVGWEAQKCDHFEFNLLPVL